AARMNRNVSAASMRHSRATGNARVNSRKNVAVQRERNFNHHNSIARNNRVNSARTSEARRNAAVNRNIDRANRTAVARNNAAVRANNRQALNRAATIDRANRAAVVNANRAAEFRANTVNAPIVNNWRGNRFSGTNYAAFRDYRREWHNRN